MIPAKAVEVPPPPRHLQVALRDDVMISTMLSWLFRPACPCDERAKAWVENRLAWLSEQFTDNVFGGRRIVLPTAEFFPDRYEPTAAGVEALAERVAQWMDVRENRLQIEIERLEPGVEFVDGRGRAVGGAAGLYETDPDRPTVVLCETQLGTPEHLVGTLAHEFAHERLMGEGRVSGDEFDNELLTDLTVVHLGLGIFLANAPRNWPADQKRWPDSQLVRPEYMSPPMFGYALAHIAWHANERKPAWRRCLGPAVRADFDQATRFLFETGNSAFDPWR